MPLKSATSFWARSHITANPSVQWDPACNLSDNPRCISIAWRDCHHCSAHSTVTTLNSLHSAFKSWCLSDAAASRRALVTPFSMVALLCMANTTRFGETNTETSSSVFAMFLLEACIPVCVWDWSDASHCGSGYDASSFSCYVLAGHTARFSRLPLSVSCTRASMCAPPVVSSNCVLSTLA